MGSMHSTMFQARWRQLNNLLNDILCSEMRRGLVCL